MKMYTRRTVRCILVSAGDQVCKNEDLSKRKELPGKLKLEAVFYAKQFAWNIARNIAHYVVGMCCCGRIVLVESSHGVLGWLQGAHRMLGTERPGICSIVGRN